jgi:polyisoprenoid-binding protein YceI
MTTETAERTTTTYTLEPSHSSVEFAVKHMLIATTKGRFQDFEVTAEVDETNFANSSATVVLKSESIDTRQPDRDAHLRSADFLDAENHPALTFVTRKIEPKGGDWRITGDLTVRGITREVVLDGEVSGPVTDPWGGRRIGLSAHGKVNRKDFGMVWNAALDAGGFVLADDVKLAIEVELLKAA